MTDGYRELGLTAIVIISIWLFLTVRDRRKRRNDSDDLLERQAGRHESTDALSELLGPNGPCEICGQPGFAMLIPAVGPGARLGIDPIERVVICMDCEGRRVKSQGGADWVRAQVAATDRDHAPA
jgi:hypothetical protein